MLLAAPSWAVGSVPTKRERRSVSTAVLTGWQNRLGGLPILIAAMVIGLFPGLEHTDGKALAALAYVVFAVLFGHGPWFVVLAQLPGAVASISTLAISHDRRCVIGAAPRRGARPDGDRGRWCWC
jgi:drug/metabolite transporter (DMT)-like permease